MAATRIVVEFQILKADGTAVVTPAGEYIGTINSQLDSLFSGIAIGINGEQVLSTTQNHILAFFQKQLNCSAEYRKSVLNSYNYFESAPGTEGASTGTSFLALAAAVKDSKKVRVAGNLSHPFFQSAKFLPPDTELSITLTQTPRDLFLITNTTSELKVSILDCYMMMRLIKMENNLQVSLHDAIQKNPFLYPFKHTVIKTFTLPKDTSNFTVHNAFNGALPSRVFALQVPTAALIGSLTTSPFSFKHNKINEYRFIYNGTAVPIEKMKFQLPDDAQILFEHVNNVLKINIHPITPSYTEKKFIKDGFFIAESLITDCSSSLTTQPFVQGSLSMELSFAEVLSENTSLVLIGEYSRSYIALDKTGTPKLIEQ